MRWVLLIVVVSLCSSCLYVVHKNFTLPLKGYVKNNSLKMNGYYLHQRKEDSYRLFLFYDNGIAYDVHFGLGYLKSEGVDSFVAKRILPNVSRLADWKNPGAFRIKDNKIEINMVHHTHYNWHRVTEYRGTILSDTTFMITSDYEPKVYPERNDTLVFHFVPGPKPDSTNNNFVLHRKWYRGK